MVNITDRARYQVKLPLKILNTSVYRGIPDHCTLATPMITQWLRGLWSRDEVFTHLGTELLGKVASVTVRHPQLSTAPGIPYQLTETLGCIWRDPIDPRLRDSESVWPLAAVLHPGLAEELITRSGADAQTWISHLLATLLRPLLHLMHHYGITVNPHGENLAVITNPEYADRLSATALTAETFARYPLNAYRLTLGYTDLDARPPIPTTGRIPNPLHSAKPIS